MILSDSTSWNISLFYEVVQVALGQREILSKRPNEENWRSIYCDALKQSVVGVAFEALEKLNFEGMKPPVDILYEWIGQAEQIKHQNNLLNKRCGEITQLFLKEGYKCCILKGQGNALMYEHKQSRTPGDIDLWVWGRTDNDDISKEQLRKDITTFVRDRVPKAFEQSHHIDFPIYEDIMVEVHYTPNILSNPKYNRKFQQWCESQGKVAISHNALFGFFVPSADFNVVYQMVHMLSHFFIEGIGLRHFIDYFYVLKAYKELHSHDIVEMQNSFRKFGLEKFAKGVMWIEKEFLGLDEQYLLIEPSERIGMVILKEMEEGGNFGQHDQRYSFRKSGLLFRGFCDIVRLIKLMPSFPSECCWKIVEKIFNQKWKFKINTI